jgi:hypothetical protein
MRAIVLTAVPTLLLTACAGKPQYSPEYRTIARQSLTAIEALEMDLVAPEEKFQGLKVAIKAKLNRARQVAGTSLDNSYLELLAAYSERIGAARVASEQNISDSRWWTEANNQMSACRRQLEDLLETAPESALKTSDSPCSKPMRIPAGLRAPSDP